MRAALAAASTGLGPALAPVLALALSAAPAMGQDRASAAAESADLSGFWVFEVAEFGDGEAAQYLRGELQMTSESADRWSCMLWVDDVFEAQDAVLRAEEACTAVRTGTQLSIRSEILRVDPPTATYIPDNFILKIESAARMTGSLIVLDGQRPHAVFVRGEAPIS